MFRKARRKRKMQAILKNRTTALLMSLVVFVMTFAPVLPTIAEKITVCGMTEHVHTDECYEEQVSEVMDDEGRVIEVISEYVLVCGIEEHTHSDECYEEKTPETLVFTGEANGVYVKVTADDTVFPEGTTMTVSAVDISDLPEAVPGFVTDTGAVVAVDICFFDINGTEIEPSGPVEVAMSSIYVNDENTSVVHLDDNGDTTVVSQTVVDGDTVSFSADGFSIYIIIGQTVEEEILASDGNNYRISVTCGEESGIPEGSSLSVSEISEDSDEYLRYYQIASEALDYDNGMIGFARFFDISIIDANGNEIQPRNGSEVRVRIELSDVSQDNLKVIHFSEETEILDAREEKTEDGCQLRFSTTGFSVYGVVDEPVQPVETVVVSVVGSLDELVSGPYYLSVARNSKEYYFSNSLNSNSAFVESLSISDASAWYFESAGQAEGQYLIYTFVSGEKKYITNPSGNLAGLADASETVFELEVTGNGRFYFKKNGERKWLQHSGSGSGMRFYTDNNNAANCSIQITSYDLIKEDPYGLDGKSFGIAFNNESVTAVAMTSDSFSVSGKQRLEGLDMLIRPDVLDNEGILLVAEGTDLTEWIFEYIEGDRYYLKTVRDGQTYYLEINGSELDLVEGRQNGSQISAVPGTDGNSGKWRFAADGRSIKFEGTASKGFSAAAESSDNSWFNLLEKSILQDGDFTPYNAQKVSISDNSNVYDQQEVIIYTRIWNETKKRYEFFAVDHDGSLIRCYDTGDGIEWIGSDVNTALWHFTEYRDKDGSVNYYYELQNTQYGNYLAPQGSGNQVFSDNTIGINLNGRRYGRDYSAIIAWDDSNYAYSGLRTENGRIVSCPIAEAQDFYFAVIKPVDPVEGLTTIKTIDNNEYGITMKMVDFNNAIVSSRDSVQTSFFGEKDINVSALLSTDLNENGYPVRTDEAGRPLSDLFTGMQDVNHLFIESIHNESGYFEYNSTENFAHLNSDGTFTVYDQLAAIGNDTKKTRTHGQFMPYNELTDGKFSEVTNMTDVLGNELPDTNPRKGEKLFLIEQDEADYFFGMEMQAKFTQTPSGLDAWGHDIIFEFSGDDDFWLYVDGELALDLGGVHSASTGSINFRTGEISLVVKDSKGDVIRARTLDTTLYEVFKANYQTRGLSESEISSKLDEIFVKNGDNYIFRDYTDHTMKMFYMERGAGASNLHMRFNLAAVKPGTFILSKKLSGTENQDNSLIEFPYQIYFKTEDDGEYSDYRLLTEKTGDEYNVFYAESNVPVKYMDRFVAAQGSKVYENVFFLKPGESAEVNMPEKTTDYYVVECALNPDIYDVVKVNDEVIEGTQSQDTVGGTYRRDYVSDAEPLKERSKVEYENHVRAEALRTLSITKRVYDTDGTTILHADECEDTFTFRLYLGDENADPSDLPLANMYEYSVKDGNGNYCKWDSASQKLVSIGKSDYSQLSESEKNSVIFHTSIYGSISKIPADHTVEIRDLIISTQYKVEERSGEIPRGYTQRVADGYTRIDLLTDIYGDEARIGTIAAEEDPEIEVRNQIGWGLTAEKIWTDKDFMKDHADIYIAVYLRTGSGDVLLEDKVRRLTADETDIYFFFYDLYYEGTAYNFSDFYIREVTIDSDYTVEEDGTVSLSDNAVVTALGEGGNTFISGTPIYPAQAVQQNYSYSVSYRTGELTGKNNNVRTDTVTNSRPGIELYKHDVTGRDLAGAVFTLTDDSGNDIGQSRYVSDDDGLITIAYLPEGRFTLTEIAAPTGFVVMDDPVVFIIENGELQDPDNDYCTVSEGAALMKASVTVINRPVGLQAIKVDDSGEPLEGAHFALYLQVTDNEGNQKKDSAPVEGFENIVSDENGVLVISGETEPAISISRLGSGRFVLVETAAADGFVTPAGDDAELWFTIGEDGKVSVDDSHDSWLTRTVDSNTNNVSYLIKVPNTATGLTLVKIDDQEVPLSGAVFKLERIEEGHSASDEHSVDYKEYRQNEWQDVTSGSTEGTIDLSNAQMAIVHRIKNGLYCLTEITTPDGYYPIDGAVYFRFENGIITLTDAEGRNQIAYDCLRVEGTTIRVINRAGAVLPEAGGIGTVSFRTAGIAMMLIGVMILVCRRKQVNAD